MVRWRQTSAGNYACADNSPAERIAVFKETVSKDSNVFSRTSRQVGGYHYGEPGRAERL